MASYNFPLSILKRILYLVVREEILDPTEFKSRLTLLWVCRKWSLILAPLIYSYGVIRCKIKNEPIKTNDTHKSTRLVLTSNIECIRQRNISHRVKHLTIDMSANDVMELLTLLINELDIYNLNWSGVNSIILSVHEKGTSRGPDRALDATIEIKENLANSSLLFLQYLPNITDITIHGFPRRGIAKLFVETLANAYGVQMKKFICFVPLRLTMSHFMSSLTYLHLNVNSEHEHIIPFIFSTTLKQLELVDLPVTFTWRHFSAGVGDRRITFTNLEILELSFEILSSNPLEEQRMISAASGELYYQIAFPKLKTMRLYNFPPGNDIMHADFGVPYLETVIIVTEMNFAFALEKVNFNPSTSFQLDIHAVQKKDEESYYKVTNNLFGNARAMTNTTFKVASIPFEIDLQKIKWTYLKNLHVDVFFNRDNLLKLISLLPGLERLSLGRIFTESELDMLYYYLQNSANQYVESLYTNIRILAVGGQSGTTDSHYMLIIHFLTLRIPSLERLLAGSQYHAYVRNFLGFFTSQYPHLANVKLYNN
ncbi:hypothetical protein COEREDRAFT_99129 [Coemansia reversa NRRL 1564]|uniref:F-box domain-containing protein n=1 Tax=Coemansia reversa (strain ATCC 12441 / NRRL 1564) TaxID=763665 RepID=A0A2G5B586_COERN|nr:hypothetical protein COEREDRAFT_99129 [Coemansia reversa NRRL 1564]|eukprot:PIA14178.1 hypothetical protein COEREDRAFT_99129 [Coemansia reversa NRRL 1564]